MIALEKIDKEQNLEQGKAVFPRTDFHREIYSNISSKSVSFYKVPPERCGNSWVGNVARTCQLASSIFKSENILLFQIMVVNELFASSYSCCLVKVGAKLIFYRELKITLFMSH